MGWAPRSERRKRKQANNKDFYNSVSWRRLRIQILNLDPMCAECRRNGILTEANQVDHINPINQGGDALDPSNLQPLCFRCHGLKSVKE